MLNIEHRKKQAKLYLRWYRERYFPVAARIRAVLPRYRHLTDREILDHSFRLADAQELVARTAGFESWAAPGAQLVMVEVEAVPVQIVDSELSQPPWLLFQKINDVCS